MAGIMICDQFTTNECTNGHCPVALQEEGVDQGVTKCSECHYHTDCKDCDWFECCNIKLGG